MTPLEAEAMLVRRDAAIKWLETTDESGRWELLGEVVAPNDEALRVSLLVAEERGPSHFARTIAATHRETLRRSGPHVGGNAPKRREWLRV